MPHSRHPKSCIPSVLPALRYNDWRWGGGSVPSLPPIGTGAPYSPQRSAMLQARCPPALQPPCQYFSTASTPPILCSLQTLNPAPSHQGIAYAPRPPPPKKHKPLGIYSPTQQTPPVAWRWCGLGVPRSGGGRSPTAACLPAPAASSSAALLRSHSGTGAAAVPGPPSVGTAGAGAAAPPLLCKICPPTHPPNILSPTGTVSDSHSTPTTPAHLCAGRGLSDPFLPALKSLPPAGCPCCSLPGYRCPPPPAHPQSPPDPAPWGNLGSQSLRGMFHPLFPYLLQ